MNAKTLYVLIAVAALAMLAAIAINISRRPLTEASEQAQPLLPQLHGHINDVSTITLTGAGAKPLATLNRRAGGWTVAEKSGYPADVAKIREFLLKLDQATLLEQKTAKPERYAELGVDEVKDKDAKGVLVDLGGLAAPTRLIIGNYNGAGGGGTFVRRDGEAQSWLVKGNIAVAKTMADWEKRDLTDIASNRLQSVVLIGTDGKTLKIYKEQPSDANFKVADVPKGRETSSEFAANGLGSMLAQLNADDVFPAKEVAPPEKVYKAQYQTFDGLVVDATGWDKDGKDYAQFSARLDDAAANARIDQDQAKAKADYDAVVATKQGDKADKPAAEVGKPLAVSDQAKDRQEKLAALNREVEALNRTFNGWTFMLPSFKFGNITKGMDDMLKPLEQKKTDAKDAAKPAAKPGKPPGN